MATTDPVSNRDHLTKKEFDGLSKKDQKRVVDAKIVDTMVARLTTQTKQHFSRMSSALKGESGK
jgi:hypothetical protein